MENSDKTEKTISKKQFASIHMKIQNKYEEMQRKLEKSRSMDSLTCNCLSKEDEKKCASVCDLGSITREENLLDEINNHVQHITILDTNQEKITRDNIAYDEPIVAKSESISNISEKCDSECESTNDYVFFNKHYFKTSLESLSEVAKEDSDECESFTPQPRTLRSRIESHLRKRQREEKFTKPKSKESKNKVDKYILSNAVENGKVKPLKKMKQATVTIALIEVTGFEPTKLEDKPRVLMFRFRLGTEKLKSKLIKSHKDVVPVQEIFNLNLYDNDSLLELTLSERDNIICSTVTDITSVLEVIIYDEKKNDEVGRVAIPLLKVRCGKNWYALKCCNLKDRAKGNNPRILLEINLVWNMIKAAIRVINPKEPNYLQQEEKLDRHVFARNLSRAKVVTTWIMNALEVFK
ncbi:unnamed protein product [Danaus chrysippus]|uniref:(African queen) hypothetical protein n=1 Tax=Danaus chrysippus TaxID=151541 RepID=A0A8J2QEG8_9NEOP|nr:unnamed protein product [Danaus chrysippus]